MGKRFLLRNTSDSPGLLHSYFYTQLIAQLADGLDGLRGGTRPYQFFAQADNLHFQAGLAVAGFGLAQQRDQLPAFQAVPRCAGKSRENGWELEWANPATLKKYLAGGQAMQVEANGKYNVEVKVQ